MSTEYTPVILQRQAGQNFTACVAARIRSDDGVFWSSGLNLCHHLLLEWQSLRHALNDGKLWSAGMTRRNNK